MRLRPPWLALLTLLPAAASAAESTEYGRALPILSTSCGVHLPSADIGEQKIAEHPLADGNHTLLVPCADSFDPSVLASVALLTVDGTTGEAEGPLTYAWDFTAGDPPGVVDFALSPDGSVVVEVYDDPAPAALRLRTVSPGPTLGARQDVVVFPFDCGGTQWTGARATVASPGSIITALFVNATSDGVGRLEPDGMGDWTCSLLFSAPVDLPGGEHVEFVDVIREVNGRTLATLTDFPSPPHGWYEITGPGDPVRIVGNGTPIQGGGNVVNYDNVISDMSDQYVFGSIDGTSGGWRYTYADAESPGVAEVVFELPAGTFNAGVDAIRGGFGTINSAAELVRYSDWAPVGGTFQSQAFQPQALQIQTLHEFGGMLDGKQLQGFALGPQSTTPQLTAFTARFSDFSNGYYLAVLASPVPASGGPGLGGLAVLLLAAGAIALATRRVVAR